MSQLTSTIPEKIPTQPNHIIKSIRPSSANINRLNKHSINILSEQTLKRVKIDNNNNNHNIVSEYESDSDDSAIEEKNFKFICSKCNKGYNNDRSFRRHKQSHLNIKHYCSYNEAIHEHNREFKCDWEDCDSAFNSNKLLAEHRKGHENKLEHKCDYDGCNSAFNRRKELTQHMVIHQENRPKIACDLCPMQFLKQQGYQQHFI